MQYSKSLRRAATAILVSATALAYAGAALAIAPGTLIVAHEANPDDVQDFTYTVDGQTPGGASLDDDATAPGGDTLRIKTKTFSVTPGDYMVSQADPGPGWVLTGIQCDGPSPASVNLPNRSVALNVATGTNITCKFLNARASAPPTGTITIKKQTAPSDPQDFAFYAFGPNSGCCGPFQLDTDPGSALPANKTFTLPPGQYSFKEDFANPVPVPGWALSSINCTGGGTAVDMNSKSFTANLQPGQNIVCTFTNSRVPNPSMGKVVIQKQVSPTHAQDFNFVGTGPGNWNQPFTLDDDLGATGADNQLPKTRVFDVPPGGYTFKEIPTNGWTLTKIECSPAANASVNLNGHSAQINVVAGQTTTCYFTNAQNNAEIRIIKDAMPNSTKDFGFTGGGPNFSQAFILDDDAGVPGADNQRQNSQAFIVPAGQYVFTEALVNGWVLTGINCTPGTAAVVDEPGRNATMTVSAGQSVTCTYRNKPTAPLPCLKPNLPLSAPVNFFVPGWATVNICRGGTVTFNKTTGSAFTVTPTVPAGSFAPIPLAAGASSGTTGPFVNTGTAPIIYKYSAVPGAPQGSIIVW